MVTDSLGIDQIDIDPMVAGIIHAGTSTAPILPKPFAARLWPLPAYRGGDGAVFYPRANLPADYVPGDDALHALPDRRNNWQVILRKRRRWCRCWALKMSSKATQLAGKSTRSLSILPWSVDLSALFTTVSNGVLLALT